MRTFFRFTRRLTDNAGPNRRSARVRRRHEPEATAEPPALPRHRASAPVITLRRRRRPV